MNMMTTDRGMMMSGMPMGAGMMPAMPMGMGMGMSGMPAMAPGMMGMMMPRCRMTFEKMDGGMRMTCTCDDKASAAMLQSLCMMTQGGLCSCAMMMNGMTCCQCNLCMGACRMELTDTGVVMTCTSGDKVAAAMIQACCDCMRMMMDGGCMCCMMMNGMPVCCSMAV